MRRLFPHFSLFTFLCTLILTGCGAGGSSQTLSDHLANPLFAEQYWSEYAEHMADFIRAEHPFTKDAVKKATIESQRVLALQKLEEVRAFMEDGRKGSFLVAEEPIQGTALLLKNTLYFSPMFLAYPNGDVRVYLTTIVDPRDGAFPDATAYEVGSLQSPYGAQHYSIPENRMDARFRTVVIHDKKLERIIGFAQL